MAASCRFAFAVHILALLAHSEAGLTSAALAASVNTHPVVIRRLLCSLRRAGIVSTQKGARAGTRLTRAAAEISLDEVYRATGPGTSFGVHAQQPDERCLVGRNIERVLGEVFGTARLALEKALSERSLADVLKTVSDDTPDSGPKIPRSRRRPLKA